METYEQKYKNGVEWLRNGLYPATRGEMKEEMEKYFPELRESDDEKIRKRIVALVDAHMQGTYKSDCITWLEKQGKNNMGISEATKQKLEDNLNKALEKETPESWNEFLETQCEQKSVWSEEDEGLFRCAIDAVKQESKVRADGCLDEEVGEMVINWLKSLSPQNTWKPSECLLESLQFIINNPDRMSDYNRSNLIEILEQLKKLKG